MKTTAKTTEVHNRIRTRKTISAISSFIVQVHYLRSVLHPYSLLFLFFFMLYWSHKNFCWHICIYHLVFFFHMNLCFFLLSKIVFPYLPLYILGSTNSCIFLYCSVLCSFPFYVHATFSLSVVCWQTSLGWCQFFGVVSEASIMYGYKYFHTMKESSLGICPEVK